MFPVIESGLDRLVVHMGTNMTDVALLVGTVHVARDTATGALPDEATTMIGGMIALLLHGLGGPSMTILHLLVVAMKTATVVTMLHPQIPT